MKSTRWLRNKWHTEVRPRSILNRVNVKVRDPFDTDIMRKSWERSTTGLPEHRPASWSSSGSGLADRSESGGVEDTRQDQPSALLKLLHGPPPAQFGLKSSLSTMPSHSLVSAPAKYRRFRRLSDAAAVCSS